eukprot:CAMPEP_0179298560 /NCGR_PEP_ID=MMETSP0797-20121207/46054_1 /TAXON_ID=47934 /ORGANISM="Dinophysis acuminata, Strain DAEP01" /LENGTH=417 /DNA_ID=CAMNT_0021007947 /DNA_START=92 /DNA_END=1345 /DNA_ORIENTATION=+
MFCSRVASILIACNVLLMIAESAGVSDESCPEPEETSLLQQRRLHGSDLAATVKASASKSASGSIGYVPYSVVTIARSACEYAYMVYNKETGHSDAATGTGCFYTESVALMNGIEILNESWGPTKGAYGFLARVKGKTCVDSTTYKDPEYGSGCSGWAFTDANDWSCYGKWFSSELRASCPAACREQGCSGDSFLLAFAGTDFNDANDVRADVNAVRKQVDLGLGLGEGSAYWAHTGFIDSYKEVWDGGLKEAFRSLASAGERILVTGHSLGGAQANLAAVEIAHTSQAKVQLATFGSPRVFSSHDADWIHANLTDQASAAVQGATAPANGKIAVQRFAMSGDPVPYVPGAGFSHFGNCFVVNFDSNPLRRQYDFTEQPQNYAPFWGSFASGLAHSHSMLNYLSYMSAGICPDGSNY